MSAIVRITATGSLIPDSTSSVPPTRCLSWIPLPRSTANTAAASVDETIAPSRNDALHGRPSACATTATMHIVPTTPTVASRPAGASERRSVLDRRVQPAVEQDERERRRSRAEREAEIVERDVSEPLGSRDRSRWRERGDRPAAAVAARRDSAARSRRAAARPRRRTPPTRAARGASRWPTRWPLEPSAPRERIAKRGSAKVRALPRGG